MPRWPSFLLVMIHQPTQFFGVTDVGWMLGPYQSNVVAGHGWRQGAVVSCSRGVKTDTHTQRDEGSAHYLSRCLQLSLPTLNMGTSRPSSHLFPKTSCKFLRQGRALTATPFRTWWRVCPRRINSN